MEQEEPTAAVQRPEGQDVNLEEDESSIPDDELDEYEGDDESRLKPSAPEDD